MAPAAKRPASKRTAAKTTATKRTATKAAAPAAKRAATKRTVTKAAAERPPLRAVKDGEKPAPPEPDEPIQSLTDAIERGTYKDVLVWQRKEAVKSLMRLNGPALAAMHRQIAALSKDIEGLRAAETEGTDIGEAITAADEDFDAEAL